jgi:hypothetical protein
MKRTLFALTAAAALLAGAPSATSKPASGEGVPRYQHVLVIVEENKDYEQILNPAVAPEISALAAKYGNATHFYAEVHPSEANYVAMLGGDTFGIHDDDAYYCKAGSTDQFCGGASAAGYADHTVRAPHLGDQLLKAGLSWKGYYENLPKPGSGEVVAGDGKPTSSRQTAYYASKHSGFMNFASVQNDPHRAERIVGFDQLEHDLKADTLPTFALVVPNQCNEMHGLHGPDIPADCQDKEGVIKRGDTYAGDLVRRIQASPAWKGRENMAIVITFDEGAGKVRGGCCGITPDAPSNFGGGHIPTIVITNHGPKGLRDDTPYSHYSLLRTLEDAFRLDGYVGHAADTDKGVVPMVRLFATSSTR